MLKLLDLTSCSMVCCRVMLTYLHIQGCRQFSTITSMTGVILFMSRLWNWYVKLWISVCWILHPGKVFSFCNFLQIRRLTFGSIKISTADHLSGFLRPSQTFTLQLLVRRCAWRLGMVPGAQRVRSGRLQPLATDMPCGKNNPPLSTPSSCPQFCYFLYGEDGCRMYGRGERPLLQLPK